MKKIVLICCFLLSIGCKQSMNLEVTTKLPKILEEVSGIQYSEKENAFWMLNDSGNKPNIYLVSEQGEILRELKINQENDDWEDITQDSQGNLYIGNFGNNANKRKNLSIFKINVSDLSSSKKINTEVIEFFYPEQKQFPAKKMYYDTEGFFEWNGFLYIFTKSRVKSEIGRTFLYRIPNKIGNHPAKRISEFTTCPGRGCWITGADISKDGKKVVLLNHSSAWLFEDFIDDDFFSGTAIEYSFNHSSQKESISFKNNKLIYVADEDESSTNRGRNLYLFKLN